MLALLVLSATLSAPNHLCHTMERFPLPPKVALADLPKTRQATKTERDAWGTYPNMITSTNFVLKWGDLGGVQQSHAQRLINSFETAWQTEVVTMGYPAPASAASYYFNVYIGSTGGTTPEALQDGGYYYLDDAGYPMIVMSTSVAADADMAESVPPHEFFHALEDESGSYSGYNDVGAWYWEASSEWAAAEVAPSNPYNASFLFGYGLVPDYPVDVFDYPDTGAFLESHQYGAFIFPRYLSEKVADRNLVRASWLNAGYQQDPLIVIGNLLAAEGREIYQTFAEFAAHNATWDYSNGATYRQWVDGYAEYYPAWDHRIAAEVPSTGTGPAWAAPDQTTLPQRFGYNVVHMSAPIPGNLTASFQGASTGPKGSNAVWKVIIVKKYGNRREYVDLPLTGTVGELVIPGVGTESDLYLVAAVFAPRAASLETFDFRYKLAYPVPEVTPPADGGDEDGGCHSVPPAPFTAGLLVLGWRCWRRRRR
ncbi:MAG: hypothetical protein HY903_04720 [Deltaproteobacteria bacterium]|nr:hypothetical protein [Deltaproteobacteria bacterium]